jgi:hypothetical protein
MTQRDKKKKKKKIRIRRTTLPVLPVHFKAERVIMPGRSTVAVFESWDISINTPQMNIKHYALFCIFQRIEMPTLATLLRSSNYGKIYSKGIRSLKLLMNIKAVIHKN